MSILKNYWLRAGLAVLTLVLGVFVVVGAMEREEAVETEKTLVNQTWHYESGNPTSATSYSSTPVADCDTGEEVICAILAPADPSDPSQPLMSPQVVNDINNALSGEPETNDTVQSFRLE